MGLKPPVALANSTMRTCPIAVGHRSLRLGPVASPAKTDPIPVAVPRGLQLGVPPGLTRVERRVDVDQLDRLVRHRLQFRQVVAQDDSVPHPPSIAYNQLLMTDPGSLTEEELTLRGKVQRPGCRNQGLRCALRTIRQVVLDPVEPRIRNLGPHS